MRFGILLPNVGVCSDVHLLAELAHLAEAVGWDGVFLWDTLHYPADEDAACDPWIALAAIAMRTQRVRIGTLVTPLSRRRPWKLARETVTLDQLSRGRLILGVGLGDLEDAGFTHVGEVADAQLRARLLDEGLEILQGLWSGRPFTYTGTQYHVQELTFLPTPLQQPRIPIWVAGGWPRKGPMRRAARWDGVYPFKVNADDSSGKLTVEDLRDLSAFIREQRTSADPFDIVMGGEAPRNDQEQAAALMASMTDAGVTWWLETVGPMSEGAEGMRRRIERGPPTT